MSSAEQVPQVQGGDGERLSARQAWSLVLPWRRSSLWGATWRRFRFGDGFSHARALGLQISLAVVPLLIAAMGATTLLDAASLRLLVLSTVLALTPEASDVLVGETLSPWAETTGPVLPATLLALAAAGFALVTAMGQVERGANRIYGIRRDRATGQKYRRAAATAAYAGLPMMAGSALLLAVGPFADAVEGVYGVDDDVVELIVRPAGVLLVVLALTALLRRAPDRRQPGWSLLGIGGLVALTLWTALTVLLAGALALISDLGGVYGPMTGVMALLIWAQMASAAILLGFAVSAEVEAAAARGLAAGRSVPGAGPPDDPEAPPPDRVPAVAGSLR